MASSLPETKNVLHVVEPRLAAADPGGRGDGALGEQAAVDGRMAEGQGLVVRGEQDGVLADDAAAWVRGRKPGLYDMQDVLGFRQA